MKRAMSGYDIKKHVHTVLSAVTNASYGTLYPTLHKLLQEGAVEVQEIPQKARPSKKVYSITQRGREELQGWLRQPPASDQMRREFLLKVYLADNLSKEDLLTLLAGRRGEAEAQLKALHKASSAVDNRHHAWMIDYALSQYTAEIAWLNQLETEITSASV
jgi:DNA-binding PadR family transcriptional regulator